MTAHPDVAFVSLSFPPKNFPQCSNLFHSHYHNQRPEQIDPADVPTEMGPIVARTACEAFSSPYGSQTYHYKKVDRNQFF